MLIDFSKIEEVTVKNFKDGEKEVNVRTFSDDTNRIMKIKMIPGASIGMHTHETNCEVIYVIEGEGTMLYEGETEILTPGMSHYCPKGCSHSFMNKSDKDLVFFAVVPQQ